MKTDPQLRMQHAVQSDCDILIKELKADGTTSMGHANFLQLLASRPLVRIHGPKGTNSLSVLSDMLKAANTNQFVY